MKKYLPIFIALVLLINGSSVFARERGSIGVNYFNSGYQFGDDLAEDMGIKQVTGSYQLTDQLSAAIDYNFGQYNNYIQGDVQKFGLGLTREFSHKTAELAVGLRGNYSNLGTELLSQELFTVTGKNLELVAEARKKLTDDLKLFAEAKYSLAGDYQVETPLLDLGEVTGYQIGSNYLLQSGLEWEPMTDLEISLGYRIGQEEITNKSVGNLQVQDYDLTKINKFTQGVYWGVTSKF